MRPVNLQGRIIGSWRVRELVLGRFPNGRSRRAYRCICKCGSVKLVNSQSLLQKNGSRMCVPCMNAANVGQASPRWTGCGDITGYIWSRVVTFARVRSIPLEVTVEDGWALFVKQNRLCALTGTPLFFGRLKPSATNASLDRIDSDLGYIDGNIQWVLKEVNIMKRAIPQDTFIAVCRLVARTHPEKK